MFAGLPVYRKRMGKWLMVQLFNSSEALTPGSSHTGLAAVSYATRIVIPIHCAQAVDSQIVH